MQSKVLFVFALGLALAAAAINDPCSGPGDCGDVEHSVCDTDLGVCGCEARYVATNDGFCEGAVGKACAIDYGKSCSQIPYALCTQPSLLTCDCSNGYVMSDDRITCWTPVVGGHCVEDAQCVGLGSASCVSNKCECNPGNIEGPGQRCHQSAAGLLQQCQNDAECRALDPNARCEGSLIWGQECVCAGDFVENAFNDACLEIAHQIGDACDVGEQCVDPNSACDNGACNCKENFVASLDGINCIPVVGAGEECVQDQQCPNQCVERVCT